MAGRHLSACRVAVFAKYPTPGLVKTRLTRCYTAEEAARLHCVLVEDLLERLAALPAFVRVELWGDQPATAPYYQSLLAARRDLQFRLQRGNDLGCRMNFAFCTSLRRSSRVILVGSDCPDLSTGRVLALNRALESHDLALLGAEDGGYVAIALKRPCPALFRSIEWGTDRVLKQTLRVARRAGLRSCVVSTLADIDEPEDLQRYPAIAERALLSIARQ